MTRIELVALPEKIAQTFPVMQQLRPHLELDSYVRQVDEMAAEGYRLAALKEDAVVRAVAGFRIGRNLAWGRFLYVDDLVSDEHARSRGHGALLVRWLEQHARAQGCSEMHLDSGVQRHAAHRFYLRERMDITGYHFRKALT